MDTQTAMDDMQIKLWLGFLYRDKLNKGQEMVLVDKV